MRGLQINNPKVDDMVKEYLIFRGFFSSFKHFELERKIDKASTPEKVVDTLFGLLHAFDYKGFVIQFKFSEKTKKKKKLKINYLSRFH